MFLRQKCVLVTGSTGILGQAILEALDAEEVVALIHRKRLPGLDTEEISGDITASCLGLSSDQYRLLTDRVECVVHAAALTRLDANNSDMFSTNVIGTNNVVEFAMRAKAHLIYISTAYVNRGFCKLEALSAYEDSKRQAEAAVKALGNNATIVRPSIIIGNSSNGEISKHQGFHHVVGSMVDATLPVLPSTPGMLCDFVPRDLVANAVTAMIRDPARMEEAWITSGDSALTVDEIIAVARRVGERHGFKGAPPRIVSYDVMQRLFVPVFIDKLPISMRRRFEANLKLVRYMNQVGPLPSSMSVLQKRYGSAFCPTSPALVLERNMECWVRRRAKSSLGTGLGAVAKS
jgi:nucleoside-diphosphate-sugar epimerase